MKKFKLNKTLFAVSVLVSSVGIANAQWSVKEVNSTAMKGTLEDMLDSLKTQISNQQALQSTMEVMSKQSSMELEETDRRNRSNAALADTIRRDRDAMPMLKQCVDLTRGNLTAGGGGKASRGGGGSANINAEAARKDMDAITSDTRRLGMAIENIAKAGACGTTEMELASRFCGTDAAKSEYNAANISPRILMGNYKGKESREYINYTLDAKAQAAANEYIRTSSLTYIPSRIHKDAVKYNEAFLAGYYRVANGITTASDAMKNVASHYYQIDKPTSAGTIFQEYWNTLAPVFKMLGMTAPEHPSLAEMYLLEINQDYYLLNKKRDEDESDIEQLKNLNRKLAISNFLAAREISLQEYQTILLSHLVVREFAPDAERLTTEANNINTSVDTSK